MAESDDAIRIYSSRWKLGGLALPCFLVAGSGLFGLLSGGLGREAIVDVGLLVIGGLCGAVMLQMAFDPKPVLEIDAAGITCRRPPIGLIPWPAVAGLGMGRVSILRTVLLIAVDEAQADAELRGRAKRYRASSFLSPTVARFQGQLRRGATVQVPISMLSVSARELQSMLQDRVRYAES